MSNTVWYKKRKMGYSPATIAMVLGVIAVAALWAFKDKLCPGVPEWCGMPGWLFPCWWYGVYCQGPEEGLPQQAQPHSMPPVATMAMCPALSTPQPVPVAMAVAIEPQAQQQKQQLWG